MAIETTTGAEAPSALEVTEVSLEASKLVGTEVSVSTMVVCAAVHAAYRAGALHAPLLWAHSRLLHAS